MNAEMIWDGFVSLSLEAAGLFLDARTVILGIDVGNMSGKKRLNI